MVHTEVTYGMYDFYPNRICLAGEIEDEITGSTVCRVCEKGTYSLILGSTVSYIFNYFSGP